MGKKKKIGLCVIVLAAACAGYLLASSAKVNARFKQITPAQASVVSLEKDGFQPVSIHIAQGTRVTFINHTDKAMWPASNLHPTHEIYPEFDPKIRIEPGGSWDFVFTKQGTWRYHDHLRPTFTGSVVVGNAAAVEVVDLAVCKEKQDVVTKQQCWDDVLEQTVTTKGLDEAFRVFGQLYDAEPDVPKACHGWAHILGKAAFDLYSEQKDLILKKETEYCGYGFFHGFIERLLQTTGDIAQVKQFCEYAAAQLKESAAGAYANCLHGIGHGSVSVDDEALWGNFQAMIDPGLHTCDAGFSGATDLRNCRDGAFNAMQQYEYRGEYGLTFNRTDPFNHCRVQKEDYKPSCYFEYAGLLAELTNRDFAEAANLIQPEKVSTQVRTVYISKLAADFMQDDLVKSSQEKNVRDCRAVAADMRDSCFQGVVIGFVAHGEPEKEHVKGLDFCRQPYLHPQERDVCYQTILGQTVSRASDVCATVPEKYRIYCHS